MNSPPLTEKQSSWLEHIQRCKQKKLSAPAYCQQYNLKLNQFYHYKQRLRQKGALNDSRAMFAKAEMGNTPINVPRRMAWSILSISVFLGPFRFQLSINGAAP